MLSCLPIPVSIWLYVCYSENIVQAGSPWPGISCCVLVSAVCLAVPVTHQHHGNTDRHTQSSKWALCLSAVLMKNWCMPRVINEGPSFLHPGVSQVLSSQAQSVWCSVTAWRGTCSGQCLFYWVCHFCVLVLSGSHLLTHFLQSAVQILEMK